jgi:hypothetical protein
MVFSTLRADRIDLSRTRARGVRDLKGFLEYAEKGPAAIAEATQPDPDADFESPFEEAVFEALVQQGWEVHKQVGCARYRIDLAIVDSAAPGRYLLGVECDGANYHRAKTARDRDSFVRVCFVTWGGSCTGSGRLIGGLTLIASCKNWKPLSMALAVVTRRRQWSTGTLSRSHMRRRTLRARR